VGYDISAIGNRLKSGVFKGRPYGGVAFLWRRPIAAYVDIIQCSSDGRCLCISLNLSDGSQIKLITVCFPCSDAGINYVNELSSCLIFLKSVIYTCEKLVSVMNNISHAMSPTRVSNCAVICLTLCVFASVRVSVSDIAILVLKGDVKLPTNSVCPSACTLTLAFLGGFSPKLART